MLRTGREITGEVKQHAVGGFHQQHPDLGRVDLAEVMAHHVAPQFLGRAREFHASRPAAHDDDGHELLQLLGVVGEFRLFEGVKDFAADAQSVVNRLEAGRVFRPLRMAEVAGHAAEGDDEVIVLHRAIREDDGAGLEIDRLHFTELDRHVLVAAQDRAQRLGDFHRREGGSGHLVKKGLKEMVILAINQRDARIGMAQGLSEVQSAKTAAEDDDVGIVFIDGLDARRLCGGGGGSFGSGHFGESIQIEFKLANGICSKITRR